MDNLPDHLGRRSHGAFTPLRGLASSVEPSALVAAIKGSTPPDLAALAWLWMTEGAPAGMKPWAYQWFRESMSAAANVDCKCVSVVGSHRFGYSLAPQKFGRSVTANSDIDALVVSESLYRQLLPSLRTAAAGNDRLLQEVDRCERRAFVETRLFPPKARPSKVQGMHNCFHRLSQSPCSVPFDVAHSSVRVYRDWHSAVSQIARNLTHLSMLPVNPLLRT